MAKINYKSDFFVLVDMKSALGGYTSTGDFQIVLRTTGSNSVTASKVGDVYTNCIYMGDGRNIAVFADSHKLGAGRVTAEISTRVSSQVFTGGSMSFVTVVPTDTELVVGASGKPRIYETSINGMSDLDMTVSHRSEGVKGTVVFKLTSSIIRPGDMLKVPSVVDKQGMPLTALVWSTSDVYTGGRSCELVVLNAGKFNDTVIADHTMAVFERYE